MFSDVDEVDPTQFLQQENGDDYGSDEQPQILASLGLTHISQVQTVKSFKCVPNKTRHYNNILFYSN